MVVEILDETQSWRIDLPDEGMYVDRLLVASRDGRDMARWRYNGRLWKCTKGAMAVGGPGVEGLLSSFGEILAECMKCQYVLHSVPKPAGE